MSVLEINRANGLIRLPRRTFFSLGASLTPQTSVSTRKKYPLEPRVRLRALSVAKCRGSWVVGRGRGSWVWVVSVGVGKCRG